MMTAYGFMRPLELVNHLFKLKYTTRSLFNEPFRLWYLLSPEIIASLANKTADARATTCRPHTDLLQGVNV